MRLLVAKTMPFMAGLRSVRGAGALLGALAAVAVLIAIGAPLLTRLEAESDHAKPRSPAAPASASISQPMAQARLGGETVVSKLAQGMTKKMAEQPTSASRLMTMALASQGVAPAPPRSQEPSFAGLSEIPHELIWNRKPDKGEKGSPKSFAAFSKASENLPWDAVEPVPFSPLESASEPAQGQAAETKRTAALQPVTLPNDSQVETWIKTKVTQIKGAERERPLYHFELWLEPPAEVKRRLVGVSYEFSTPAVMPQVQASSDQASGFRISAGGLACADEIKITLRFDDGQSEKVSIDGCKLFS